MGRHIPLLRFLLPFLSGILCSVNIGITLVLYFFIAALVFVLLSHFYLTRKINRQVQLLNSTLIYIVVFLSAVLYSSIRNQIDAKRHFAKSYHEGCWFQARLINNPTDKGNSVFGLLEVNQITKDGKSYRTIGRCNAYFKKTTQSAALNYGDVITSNILIRQIENPKNLHQFNFKVYNARKNIFHTAYFGDQSWIVVDSNEASILHAAAINIQMHLKRVFSQYIENKDVRGVAEAVVFGFKEELNDEWMEAFSRTGTIHVLAVSGLHVGIIYLMLSMLIGLSKSKGSVLGFKTVFILLALFAYSLITGFSPSVSRASTMFGLMLIAKSSGLSTNIYNTLGFACFVLLLIDPNAIFNVGFQFSFLAVLGIVYFKDRIMQFLPQSNWLMGKISTLFSVSVAAQISTFPLGLFYFHQYPNFFFFSNLIVIPCITIILYLGLFLIVFSFMPPVAKCIAWLMTQYIEFIAWCVTKIQSLPFAFLEGIPFNKYQLIVTYAIILTIAIVSKQKLKRGIAFISLLVLSFLALDFLGFQRIRNSETLLLYHKSDLILANRLNNKLDVIVPSSLAADDKFIKYTISPYLTAERIPNGLRIVPTECLNRNYRSSSINSLGNGIFMANEKTFCLIDQMDKYVEDTLVVDILLVGNKRSKYFYNAVLPKVRFKSCFVPELNFNVSKDFISRNDVKIIKRATVLSDLER